ncbi:MAG: MFS transporter [Thermodesulfobacteriota bacterium]|jgi:MFS family permease|nr:MFS transporter [Candidatus Dadabacteria bacterium]MCZ6554880.1 MFS transporter [Candidatus Dadabacteria bacterium]MCZ6685981.1 MFS transporter [Candidatus Dadabacteria bacterium]MCZ6865536.1 MFS transporter [Candidatus Dadabacteria bacterium]
MASRFSSPQFKNFTLATAANFFFFCNFSSFFLLPIYIKDLGGNEANIGFIMGSFGITSLGAIPFVAYLVDKYGRRRFMLFGYALMFVATLSYLFISQLSPVFYLLRFVQGVSFAFSFTAASTFVTDYIPSEKRAEGLGIFSAFTIASYAIGPSLGELVIELFGFYSFFIYASFFSLIAFVLTIFTRDGNFIRSSDRYGLGFFRLIASKRYALILVSNLILAGGLGAILNFVATFLRSKGLAAFYFFLTYTIAVTAVRIFGGRISDKLGRKVIASPCLLAVSISLAAMYFVESPLSAVLISLFFSIGYGFLYPTLSALVIDKAGSDERGKAMGAFNASYSLGINFLAFPLGLIARDFGYEIMYFVTGCMVFLGFILFTFFEPDSES